MSSVDYILVCFAETAPRMLWQPSNKLLRYFLRRFVSHSLWGCCQFGDCSMKSLPFGISLSLGLLFTCHLLITSWSVLQKLRQGCFDNHQINCWDTFCGDSWAIRSEAVVSLEIVAWNPYRLIFQCHWVFFSHVICWLHLGLFFAETVPRMLLQPSNKLLRYFCGDSWAIRSEAVANLEIVAWNPYRLIFLCHWVFFSHVICWLNPGLFFRSCAKDALTTIK